MRTAASPLLPIFRSRLQGELLARLMTEPDQDWTIDQLARCVGQPYQTVANEVRRLRAGDLVETRTIGRLRLVRANRASPYFEPLARLVLMSFGPPLVVAEEFIGVPGVDEVYIFGSWAARYAGDLGPAPHDVDVLLVGRPDRDEAYEAAQRAQDRLGLEVNVTIRTSHQWQHGEDAFTVQLRSSALLRISPSGIDHPRTEEDLVAPPQPGRVSRATLLRPDHRGGDRGRNRSGDRVHLQRPATPT